MQELRKCIEDIIDVYGVGGLKDERLIRNFIKQNPCGGEAGKKLLLHAIKRIPELAESGMDRAEISAIVIEELTFSQNPSKAAEDILEYLIGLLCEPSDSPKAEKPKPEPPGLPPNRASSGSADIRRRQ